MNVDPDLLDALANSDVPAHLADRFSSAMNDLIAQGLDISELEAAITAMLLESDAARPDTGDETH